MPTTTRIEVDAAPGRPRFAATSGAVAVRRVHAPEGQVRAALVNGQALLLAGDAVRLEVVVRGPVRLELVEPGGVVAHAMRGGTATWDVDVALTGGATLVWEGRPFVVSDGADVRRTTRLRLDEGCVALLRETYVFGRTGETGGDLVLETRADLAGDCVLREDLDLSTTRRGGWAGLRGARCLDAVTSLGRRLPTGMQLEVTGTLVRDVVDELHLSHLTGLWGSAAGVRC